MMDPAIEILKKFAKANELTYQTVMSCLKGYAKPRDKLSQLIRRKALIRVKQGLYVFGELFRSRPLCKELLANLIYGPSYVSLEWALSYHGLIPERVYTLTSVTLKRSKSFETPLGVFSYDHLHLDRYPQGISLNSSLPYQNFLIASKEKALCDYLILKRGKITSLKSCLAILLEDMRIDEDELLDLDLSAIRKINQGKAHSAINFLIKTLEKLQDA
jgi:hypothetical protein